MNGPASISSSLVPSMSASDRHGGDGDLMRLPSREEAIVVSEMFKRQGHFLNLCPFPFLPYGRLLRQCSMPDIPQEECHDVGLVSQPTRAAPQDK